MKTPRLLFVILLFAVSLFALTAHATLLKQLTLETQVQQSATIVKGIVVSSHTELRNKIPYTLSSVRIAESLKGSHTVNDIVTIRQRGGTVGQYEVHADGDPIIKAGTAYLMFLLPSKGEYVLSGMAQGLYTISTEKDTSVISNEISTPRLDVKTGVITSGPILSPRPASEFINEVKALIRQQSPREN